MKYLIAMMAFAVSFSVNAQTYDYPRYRSGVGPDYPVLGGGSSTSGLTPLTTCPSSVITTDANSNVVCVPLAQFVTQAVAPGAPTVSAPTLAGNIITLPIAPPSLTGGSPITGYTLAIGTAAGAEGAAAPITLTSGTPAAGGTYAIPGLTGSTTYYGKVYAVNAIGTSVASAEWTATTAAPVVTVPTPGVYAVAPGNGQNVITETTAPAANNGTITARRLYRGTTAGGETVVGAVTFPYTDTVANGTTEYYRVSATNSAGEGAQSAEVSGTPAVVTGVNITFAGAAGALTGNQVETKASFSGSDTSAFTRDGSGNLLMTQTGQDQYGYFANAGSFADGTVTATYKPGSNSKAVALFFRISSSQNGVGFVYDGANARLYPGGGGPYNYTFSANNSVALHYVGAMISVIVDGATIATVTDTAPPGPGSFGVGVGHTSPDAVTAISSVAYTP